MDSWAAHLSCEKKLSSRLYDPQEFQPNRAKNRYPASFRNTNHEENLGGGNEVFPFLTLVQGLTSLGGDILARSDRQSPPKADDTAMERD